jgi:hypothetical protein
MHTAVRKYRVSDVDEVVKRVEGEGGFTEIVKGIDGFGGYWILDGGDGTITTITVAEGADAVEESTRLAGEWVQENAADLIEERLDVTAGELKVNVTPG